MNSRTCGLILSRIGTIEETDQVRSFFLIAASVNAHGFLNHFSQFLVLPVILNGFLN